MATQVPATQDGDGGIVEMLMRLFGQGRKKPIVPTSQFNETQPWNDPSLAAQPTVPNVPMIGSNAPGRPDVLTSVQPAPTSIGDAIALAEKLRKQREIAAMLIPEQMWNK